jgi:DNA-binding transcriptional MerR regulator
MATEGNKSKKLYYSIKEVAKIIGVSESTLRFWEKEFPHVKPRTAGLSNIRQYTEKNIEDLKIIYNLIKVRGFKIAAARQYLKNNREGVNKSSEVITLLEDTLAELKDIKKHLDLL